MSWDDVGDSLCPTARALAVLGDRWTLMIIRELFLGTRRFDVFQAQTGMSPHLLSVRLKRLEEDGVIERRLYQTRPPRHEYRLTEKGKDLLGVILALRAWGLRWCGLDQADEPAVRVYHAACGTEIGADRHCPTCGIHLNPRDVRAVIGDAYGAERAARQAGVAGGRSDA